MRAIAKLFFALGLLGAMSAQAASVSYYLNDSNVTAQYPDGPSYLEVTIADGVNGNIDFTVQTLSAVLAGGMIDSFGFNTTRTLTASNITGLTGWAYSANKTQDGFGRFTSTLAATKNSAVQPLRFSLSGISGDSIYDYVNPSSGSAGSSGGVNLDFAAHVIRLTTIDPLVTSAWFAGSTEVTPPPSSPSIVPVPPAVWLLGSGLIGLVGVARRREAT